jgi:phosphoglycerate-specific signal transduction histidine kinase
MTDVEQLKAWDLFAVKMQHRVLLTQRLIPLLADAVDAIELDAPATALIVALATQYGRYGDRRITAMLQAAGWAVNVKRVERIWRLEGLKVPGKQSKKGRL